MCFDPFVTPGIVIAATEAGTVATASTINWTAIMGAASLASIAGGFGMQIASQSAAREASRRRGEYEAQVAANNAELADRLADDALARGEIAEKQHRLKLAQIRGQQRAGLAASGQVVDQGSAADLVSDTAKFGELDALTIRNNAEREALGYRTRAYNFQTEAQLAPMRAFTPDTTLGTALTGVSTLADRYMTYRSRKVF